MRVGTRIWYNKTELRNPWTTQDVKLSMSCSQQQLIRSELLRGCTWDLIVDLMPCSSKCPSLIGCRLVPMLTFCTFLVKSAGEWYLVTRSISHKSTCGCWNGLKSSQSRGTKELYARWLSTGIDCSVNGIGVIME